MTNIWVLQGFSMPLLFLIFFASSIVGFTREHGLFLSLLKCIYTYQIHRIVHYTVQPREIEKTRGLLAPNEITQTVWCTCYVSFQVYTDCCKCGSLV